MSKPKSFAEVYKTLDIGLVALTLIRIIRAYLGVLKLLIEGVAGNFTNWPMSEAKANDLLQKIFILSNEQRILLSTFWELDRSRPFNELPGMTRSKVLNSDTNNSESPPIFGTTVGSSQEPEVEVSALESTWMEIAKLFKVQLSESSDMITKHVKLLGSEFTLKKK